MRPHSLLIALLSLLLCSSAYADDYFITHLQGDYEAIYAIPSSSITELGDGVKRAELLAVGIDRIEMEKGVYATIGDLAVMVIEVNCLTTPWQFKENSEYVQFSRSSEPIDKTSINPYKDWTKVPSGSGMHSHARFICEWPKISTELDYTKIAANSRWDFVDIVIDTVKRVREKQSHKK